MYKRQPYGTTRNYWDVPLPLPELWEAVKWAVKPNGAVLFFAQCPFDKVLGASNLAIDVCKRQTLARICETLNCEITDVIELVPDEPASIGGKEHERIETKNNGERN